jgi:predicted Zn finger-like uncharacterized protein
MRYTLDEAQLGPNGRTVRCTACKTTWHAEKPEIPIDLSFSDTRKPEKVEDLQSVKAKTLPHTYRALVEDKKRARELTAQGMVWGALAAAAVLILALGYFLRVEVVKTFPRVAGAYAMVGIRVNPTHLQIVSYTADKTFKAGRFVVAVQAQIKNLSGKPVPVPPVRVRLIDATLQQFDSVLLPPGGLVLAPNATRTLTFDVRDPKNLTASLDMQFDIEAMKSLKRNTPLRATPEPSAAAEPPPPTNASEADTSPAPEVADSDAGPEDTLAAVPQQALSTRPMPSLRPALPSTPDDDTSSPHSDGHRS